MLLLASVRAGAVECAPIRGGSPALVHVDAEVRLAFLRDGLRSAAHRARLWSWGWGLGYSALTVGQLAITPLFNSDDRKDYYVGAFGSAVGVTALLARPLRVMGDQRWLERRLAATPGADPCARLAEAERLLLRDAASEEEHQRWFVHAGNFAFNAGLGLVLAFWFQHYRAAATNTIIGITIGEIQLYTMPSGSVALLARYRDAALAPPTENRITWQFLPLPLDRGAGLAIAGSFE